MPTEHNKLSIVIPAYNGEEFLAETLNSITEQDSGGEVEVIVCDDRSSDKTREIAESFCAKNENIHLYENHQNLGMDRNFEQAASHATGEYIWFCGQDDIIGNGAIKKVISILGQDSAIDFIYVNYGQYTHDLKKVIRDKMLQIDADILCTNHQSFFDAIVGTTRLPSFLPSFILRRTLWHRVDKSPFYGTQFVQIGVFLALLRNLRSYIIAHPYVKGRIPDSGWQQNRLTVLDIFTGFLEVITYYFKKDPDLITKRLYRKQFSFSWKNILYNIYRLKMQKIPLNRKITDRISRIFSLRHKLVIYFFLMLPHGIFSLFNPLAIILVRGYKKRYSGSLTT